MTHESRRRAAAELALRVARRLLAGEWPQAVAEARGWYHDACPRWRSDEVEVRLAWVGTALIALEQYRERSRREPGDPGFMLPAYADEEFRRYVHRHFADTADTYVRHCDRLDNHPCAEDGIRATVEMIEKRRATPAGVTT